MSEERDKGSWSFNVAAGYHSAIHQCENYLKEAIHYLENQQDEPAQKYMTLAQGAMNEADRWFNRANNEKWRIDALVAEIKALRSGQGVSYATGQDPTDDDWRKSRISDATL